MQHPLAASAVMVSLLGTAPVISSLPEDQQNETSIESSATVQSNEVCTPVTQNIVDVSEDNATDTTSTDSTEEDSSCVNIVDVSETNTDVIDDTTDVADDSMDNEADNIQDPDPLENEISQDEADQETNEVSADDSQTDALNDDNSLDEETTSVVNVVDVRDTVSVDTTDDTNSSEVDTQNDDSSDEQEDTATTDENGAVGIDDTSTSSVPVYISPLPPAGCDNSTIDN